jgi:hypothetical protein
MSDAGSIESKKASSVHHLERKSSNHQGVKLLSEFERAINKNMRNDNSK